MGEKIVSPKEDKLSIIVKSNWISRKKVKNYSQLDWELFYSKAINWHNLQTDQKIEPRPNRHTEEQGKERA